MPEPNFQLKQDLCWQCCAILDQFGQCPNGCSEQCKEEYSEEDDYLL